MQHTPANPYQNLAAIREADMFFGRSALLRRLYSAVASQQCISLVGPRHIGKSSVLTCMILPEIQRQFEYDLHKHVFVPLDLRKYRKQTSEFFFESVSEQILTQCHEHPRLVPRSRKGSDAFSFVLEQMTNKGHKLVLIMDAFDHIVHNENLDFEFFSYLRAEAQVRGISYITSSIASLLDICRQDVRESPFFNIFGLLNIGPLTPNEAQELITRPAQRIGSPFTETEQQWISSLASCHPFFIQRICYLLIEEKCQFETSTPDLRRVEELAYAELQPHFMTLLEDLSVHEQRQLENQVRQDNAQPKIHPELSESFLFQRFLREKYNRYLSKIPPQGFEQTRGQTDNLPILIENSDTRQKFLKKPTLVLMAGLPGTGKTTLALELGQRLGWTVLEKDLLKEPFLEVPLLKEKVDEHTAGWAAYENVFYVAENFLVDQQLSVILDTSLLQPFILERAKQLTARSGAQLKIILCEVDESTRRHRLRMRKTRLSQGKAHLFPKEAAKQFDQLDPLAYKKIRTKRPLKTCVEDALIYIIEGEQEMVRHQSISTRSNRFSTRMFFLIQWIAFHTYRSRAFSRLVPIQ